MPRTSAAKCWCFTWNNPTEPILFDPSTMGYLCYALEKTLTSQYHYQGYVEFLQRTRQPSALLHEKAHCIKANGSAEENLAYCTKAAESDDAFVIIEGTPSRSGVKRDYDQMVESIMDGSFSPSEHPQQYIRHSQGVTKLRQHMSRKRATAALNFDGFRFDRDWQVEIETFLQMPASDRIVHWYYDTTGNAGKSTFAKYLTKEYKALYLETTAKERVLYAYNNEPLVVFDIARADATQINYGTFETLKNGIGFNTMYHPQMLVFATPHVVVFSNVAPDLTKLSQDRWHVVDISAPTLGTAQYNRLMSHFQE